MAPLGAEPFSLVFVKGDAPFKKLVLDTMRQLYTSGSIRPIYHKWFTSEIPPEGISLNLPVSEPLDRVFRTSDGLAGSRALSVGRRRLRRVSAGAPSGAGS